MEEAIDAIRRPETTTGQIRRFLRQAGIYPEKEVVLARKKLLAGAMRALAKPKDARVVAVSVVTPRSAGVSVPVLLAFHARGDVWFRPIERLDARFAEPALRDLRQRLSSLSPSRQRSLHLLSDQEVVLNAAVQVGIVVLQ